MHDAGMDSEVEVVIPSRESDLCAAMAGDEAQSGSSRRCVTCRKPRNQHVQCAQDHARKQKCSVWKKSHGRPYKKKRLH